REGRRGCTAGAGRKIPASPLDSPLEGPRRTLRLPEGSVPPTPPGTTLGTGSAARGGWKRALEPPLSEEPHGGTPFGESCLAQFTAGLPEFVLDTDASVANGATFLVSPAVERGRDCVRACCMDPRCNLALVEQLPGELDAIKDCFLLDCLYDQAFVCKFARKDGFLNYVKKEVCPWARVVVAHLLARKSPSESKTISKQTSHHLPARDPALLRGTESFDDNGIVSYDWTLLSGDSSVSIEVSCPQNWTAKPSQTDEGIYMVRLTVTDTVGQQDSTNITVTVLTPEQTIGNSTECASAGD
uniref:PKD/Chitinase domain-containing protein n=1 Tax=Varanus komodoensis TaxID=61221 RepID=A0A8D2KXS7_VARKO